MTGPVTAGDDPGRLYRFMYLSIGAAILTIALKATAALITGSVGLLSDALESSVNLVAAVLALFVLRVAVRPPDPSHEFGHGQAEYLSVMAEGAMIVIAAAAIIWSALQRLLHPAPLDLPVLGLVLATAAAVVNLVVGLVLQRVGRRRRSMTLVADGKHLMTDVWTSVGVLAGIALVAFTGWVVLDPIVALAVGANILWTGYRLLRRSVSGLLSRSIPPGERQLVEDELTRFAAAHGVEFAPLRTVELGRRRLIQAVMRVPGDWTVEAAHDLARALEDAVEALLPETETIVHVEPRQPVARDADR
ncbi:cation diffusion facilitator family transporter [Agromyces bauzanensis]